MQTVITLKEAKQITGGRTPLVPVEYESAVKALAECITLDEAKYWDNKADALAAWAKIYHSPDAERKARQLKLHAYRRMGELAEELRPSRRKAGKYFLPGGESLLREIGLNESKAKQAVRLRKIPPKEFEALVNKPTPPAPYSLLAHSPTKSEAWNSFTRPVNSPMSWRTYCRGNDARSLARGMVADEAQSARRIVVEITEWLDAFEQALPKK